jgi:hypothetical protein
MWNRCTPLAGALCCLIALSIVPGVALDGLPLAPSTVAPHAGGMLQIPLGSDDLRISDMGPDGDTEYEALSPDVAYNSANHEYLVVWQGDHVGTGADYDIFIQRIDATTGLEIGTNDVRISSMGPDGTTQYGAFQPAVAYNSTNNEFLVAWVGDDNVAGVDNDYDIFIQRIDAETGSQLDPNDHRISSMGPSNNPLYGANPPAVAYNSVNNEYLVVWSGDDGTPPLVDNEQEIYIQRIDAATGAEVGTDDQRISSMGPDGDSGYDARQPAVAYNSVNNEYLVVWEGDDDTLPLVNEDHEIYVQRIDAATGSEVGSDDERVSSMGAAGDPLYDAYFPTVTYNSTRNEYLVGWIGDDDATGVDGEYDIFVQRIDAATGNQLDPNDHRITSMGLRTGAATDWDWPDIIYNSSTGEYLVVFVFQGEALPVDGMEIFGQRVDSLAREVGADDFRISEMGPDGDVDYDAARPAVAYNREDNHYLVVWQGEDDTPPLVNNEHEIFGQRLMPAALDHFIAEAAQSLWEMIGPPALPVRFR